MATVASGLNSGSGFGSSDTITQTTLNNHVNSATVTSILTADISDSTNKTTGVTFAKMQHISTAKVLGNVSGSEGDVSEVSILDEDNMSSDSATSVATQQSIKAYVDNSSKDGFTPTSYTGEESVTLPNGLILKWGSVSVGADSSANATFGTAFPNAIVSAQATLGSAFNSGNDAGCAVYNLSTTGLTVQNGWQGGVTINWHAIGR